MIDLRGLEDAHSSLNVGIYATQVIGSKYTGIYTAITSTARYWLQYTQPISTGTSHGSRKRRALTRRRVMAHRLEVILASGTTVSADPSKVNGVVKDREKL